MLHFKNKLEIHRPVADVFSFISNFENMPKWNYFVLEVRKLSGGSIGLNTTFRQIRKTDSQEYKITEFEPNRRVTVEKLAGGNVKSAVTENLQKLKQLLETGKVILQDGRTAAA